RFIMKVTWNKLPKELVAKILDGVDAKKDLLQLQLVSKDWSAIATEKLYEAINLYEIGVPLLLTTLTVLGEERRFAVKSVNITAPYAPSETSAYDDLYTLLRICPNISDINSSGGEVPESLYLDVVRLRRQGYLQNLQHIPQPCNYAAIDAYISAALAIKKNINRVLILEDRSNGIMPTPPKKPKIDLFGHLKDFPQLKVLIVWHTSSEPMFETITNITQNASSLEAVNLKLENSQAASNIDRHRMLALSSLLKRPCIRRLEITTATITSVDLRCLQYIFNGLHYLSVKVKSKAKSGIFQTVVPLDGAPLLAAYLAMFSHVVSIQQFVLCNFPVVYDVDETLAFWSKQPQVNAIKITEGMKRDPDVVFLTVENTKESKGYFTENVREENDGWLMELKASYRDFGAFCQRSVEQFSGNAIEYISLCASSNRQAQPTVIGNLLDYAIDHYTAIKHIALENTGISSFQAETVRKPLTVLEFVNCQIHPSALKPLSLSVGSIDRFIFRACKMLSNGSFDDKTLLIDMPETAIGVLNVRHKEDNGGGKFSYLVKVSASIPIRKTHFFSVTSCEIEYLEEQLYQQMCIENRDDELQMQVILNCQSLQAFCVLENSHQLVV
ncbi:hypothetical protein MBANPS3_004341, partial [Mucor bainieri]